MNHGHYFKVTIYIDKIMSTELSIDERFVVQDIMGYLYSGRYDPNNPGCFMTFGTNILKNNDNIFDICGSKNVKLEIFSE
jgi:hypothetical protein